MTIFAAVTALFVAALYLCLFLGIIAMAARCLHLAYLIGWRGQLALVRDWRGRPIPRPAEVAKTVVRINTTAAFSLIMDVMLTLGVGLPMYAWSGLAGFVLLSYFILLELVAQRQGAGA